MWRLPSSDVSGPGGGVVCDVSTRASHISPAFFLNRYATNRDLDWQHNKSFLTLTSYILIALSNPTQNNVMVIVGVHKQNVQTHFLDKFVHPSSSVYWKTNLYSL